ncbi:unnamed protein product [Linum trigynum]|uniref:Uncharacterized protein n=1 Tax=Linum trigynum TaxID=586398 RepID=A0AAV2F0C8_9ROSI
MKKQHLESHRFLHRFNEAICRTVCKIDGVLIPGMWLTELLLSRPAMASVMSTHTQHIRNQDAERSLRMVLEFLLEFYIG